MNRPSKIAFSALALALLAGAAIAQQAGSSTAPTAGAQSPRQMDQAGVSRHAAPDSTMAGGAVMALPGGQWDMGIGGNPPPPGPSWQRVGYPFKRVYVAHGDGCGCTVESWSIGGVNGQAVDDAGDPMPAGVTVATGPCSEGDYYNEEITPVSGPAMARGWTCVFK